METKNIGNVLVIGNSGVGKSTLINAVLGAEQAVTSWGGITGTTKELKIYENPSSNVPFRLVDTVGFEPTLIKETRAALAIKKWSDACVKDGKEDHQINVIWFCIDGTSSKLFKKTVSVLSKATAMWKSVPVIAVITKSYSEPERARNVEMVKNAFATEARLANRLKKIIPVVAETYTINDSAFVPPDGIGELIDATIELIPEGLLAGAKDLAEYKLKRKRSMAHGVVGSSTLAGIAVGAVPVPFSDALILSSLEVAEINSIARIYGINKDERSKHLLNSIVEVGTVSAVAKAAISALKAVPGINLAASAMNAIIAGSFIACLGEGAVYVFEQIYLGNRSIDDIDWVTKFMESKMSSKLVDLATAVATRLEENDFKDKKTIAAAILEVIAGQKQTTT